MNFKSYLEEGYGSIIKKRMKIEDPLVEGVIEKKVKIQEGDYKGHTGIAVFTNLNSDDVRYYVVELDRAVKDVSVVIVYNGEYDFE
jgi:transcription elongation factor